MEHYYRFILNENNVINRENKQINSLSSRKNNLLTNKNTSNFISKLGSNIINSVKQTKNYVLEKVIQENYDNLFKANSNTPQRHQTKITLLSIKETCKSNSMNKFQTKGINNINYKRIIPTNRHRNYYLYI